MRTNVVFRAEKPLVLGGANKNSVAFDFFLFGVGRGEFSTLVADLSTTKDLGRAKGTVLSFRFGYFALV